jgi:bifunctional non-homologous end joining protein LigD
MASQRVTVGGITVEESSTGKVFFPGDGITKGDLIEYYQGVAGRMLPYLAGRPVSMARYPDGITGQRIVQKNVPDYFPGWITRITVPKQGGTVHHVLCDKPATLVYLANQACIEPHIFLSRTTHPDHPDELGRPDQLVIDFDPSQAADFDVARQAALWLRALLDGELGVTCFAKTTGGKGLHVHLPLDRKAGFDEVREFAVSLAGVLATRHPDVLTTEQRKEHRGGRVYLDVMRNAYAQTVVAPYAVRAREGATVATPLHWDEVEDKNLKPGAFTLRTIPGRLAGTEDPWAGMARRRYGLARLRQRLDRVNSA